MAVSIFFGIFALDFEIKRNQMGKNWWKYIVVFALLFGVAKPLFAADEEVLPVVEMRPDRVVIYPGRMELNGEETLFDMLQLYPDLLTNAYDNWLSNYEIRIDNGPYGGDIRVLLNEMKACCFPSWQWVRRNTISLFPPPIQKSGRTIPSH